MSQFLSRTKIATEILVQIHKHGKQFPLHKVTACSLSYAEQIVAKLKRDGLVRSMRGPGGGYVLAKPLKNITVCDIMAAVEPDFFDRKQRLLCGCSEEVHQFWERLKEHFCDKVASQLDLDDVEAA